MGVRFRGYIQSTHTKTNYTVELWDTTYTSTGVTEIKLFGEGFQITYEGQGDEIYAPIKGSACKVFAGITRDSAGTLLQEWIENSVLATKEDLYHVAIYEDTNLYWFGVILPSLGNEPDDSKPYDFVIQATDGLARLKDKEFELAKTAYYPDNSIGRYTFSELIYEVLKASPLYMATTQSILFSTAVGYYEDGMPAKADNIDPLAYSSIRPNTFVILEENKEPEGQSYYDVLVQICESWGMRCILSGGIYRFYQVQSYNDDGVQRWERFYARSTGNYVLSDNFTGYEEDLEATDIPTPINGNQWEFYDPLKYVFLKFPFGKAYNMLNETGEMPLSGSPSRYTYETRLRDNIVGGAGVRLNFSTTLGFYIKGVTSTTPADVVIRIQIKIGTWYLKKDILGANLSWTNNSTDVFEMLVPNVIKSELFVNIAFQTPELPSGTHNSNNFYIRVPDITIASGSGAGLAYSTSQYVVTRVIGSTSLKFSSSGNANEDTYFEYIAGNTASPINSYDLELPETTIGESNDVSNPGNIFTSPDGINFSPSTAKWRLEDTGTSYQFGMIRVRDVLTSQIVAIRKYQGGLIGSMIYGHSSLAYSGKRYILNGATYNAMNERWDGEWIEVSYSRASFEEIQGATNQAGSGGEQQLRREIGDLSNRDNIGNNFVNSFITQQQINYITTGVSGATTQIPVDLFSDVVRKDDYLRIMTPDGGGNFVIHATADTTGSFVDIDSVTFSNFVPENSYVMFDLADIIERVRLGNQAFFTMSTSQTLKAFAQIVNADTDGITLTLPSASACLVNNKTCEITIKNTCSGSSDTIKVQVSSGYIDAAGTTELDIAQTHAVTFFTDGTNWFIKCSFKHP